MTTTTRPTTDWRLVVGYDGSPPAERALNAAVNLLQGRTGRIEVDPPIEVNERIVVRSIMLPQVFKLLVAPARQLEGAATYSRNGS